MLKKNNKMRLLSRIINNQKMIIYKENAMFQSEKHLKVICTATTQVLTYGTCHNN